MFSDLFHGVLGLMGGVLTVVMQLPHVSFTQTKNVRLITSRGAEGRAGAGRDQQSTYEKNA